jgi:hypothetical protein
MPVRTSIDNGGPFGNELVFPQILISPEISCIFIPLQIWNMDSGNATELGPHIDPLSTEVNLCSYRHLCLHIGPPPPPPPLPK